MMSRIDLGLFCILHDDNQKTSFQCWSFFVLWDGEGIQVRGLKELVLTRVLDGNMGVWRNAAPKYGQREILITIKTILKVRIKTLSISNSS
jgi:hypothetical protein